MKNFFFSIIIPTLNEDKYLPKLLTDLTNQKGKNFEVIIADGDSDDNTLAAASLFKSRLDIKSFNTKKRNLSFQRNFGAKKAKGDYLVFIDADSRVDRNFVRNIEKVLEKKRPLIIFPLYATSTRNSLDKSLLSIANYLLEISRFLKLPLTPGACLIFEKHFFSFIGGFRVTEVQAEKKLFPEDIDLLKRAQKAGVFPYIATNVKFKFSLRRYEREGKIEVITKYFLGALEMFMRGKANRNISYRMGGDYYLNKNDRNINNQLTGYFNKIKKSMEDILEGLKD